MFDFSGRGVGVEVGKGGWERRRRRREGGHAFFVGLQLYLYILSCVSLRLDLEIFTSLLVYWRLFSFSAAACTRRGHAMYQLSVVQCSGV